jgi:hypothetical protein
MAGELILWLCTERFTVDRQKPRKFFPVRDDEILAFPAVGIACVFVSIDVASPQEKHLFAALKRKKYVSVCAMDVCAWHKAWHHTSGMSRMIFRTEQICSCV